MIATDLAAGQGIQPRLYSTYLFDLDGTVYLGDELIPGASRVLRSISEAGRRALFLSNNPTRDLAAYVTKLIGLGLDVDESQIITPLVTMPAWLQEHHPGEAVFPIAEPPVIRALDAAGIPLSDDPREVRVVIASYDRTLTYRKLQIAFDAIWQHGHAKLITTNPDRYCPFPGGRGEPDAAGVVAAIEATTGVKCSANMGKPDSVMVKYARQIAGDAGEAIMVGDRLYTDVRMGVNSGIDTALVLTGDSTVADVAETSAALRPTYVLDSIDGLIP